MTDKGEFPGEGGRRVSTRKGTTRILRRSFQGLLGVAGLSTILSSPTAASSRQQSSNSTGVRDRITEEFRTRQAFSREQLLSDADTSTHASNGRISEDNVVAKFGKSLPHDENGLPKTDAYEALVTACESGEGFESIPQAYEGVERPTFGEIDDDDDIDFVE